jgi:hypothetical protein
VIARQQLAGKARISHNSDKEVIEVMGNASGKNPETLKALCMAQLFLTPFLPGNIDSDSRQPKRPPRAVEVSAAPAQHPTRFAARVKIAKLHLKEALLLNGARKSLPDWLPIFRMNEFEKCLLRLSERSRTKTEDSFKFSGPQEAILLKIMGPRSDHCRFRRESKPLFTLLKEALGFLALCRVTAK